MKSKTQFQVGFEFPAASDARRHLVAFLSLAGYGLSSLVEEEGKKVCTLSVYLAEKETAAKLLKCLGASRIGGVKVFSRVHREKDWSSRWKVGWKPFPLTRKLQVIPLWQKIRKCPQGKTPVFLDTTNAFGTGLHETTRFTAQIIEGLAGKFVSFLDVGTGSGILVIAAIKSGAKACVAIDIDPGAVKVARQNLRANLMACALKACDLKDFQAGRLFDLVAANLVSADLIEFRDRILAFVKPGGYLVVSGVSLENIQRVKRSFGLAGIRPVRVVKGREWSALLFRI